MSDCWDNDLSECHVFVLRAVLGIISLGLSMMQQPCRRFCNSNTTVMLVSSPSGALVGHNVMKCLCHS